MIFFSSHDRTNFTINSVRQVPLVRVVVFMVSLLACSVSLGACETMHSPAGNSSDVSIEGAGKPTIVFEAGLGDGKESWDPVIKALGGRFRSVTYSRPGYGGLFTSTRMDGDEDGHRSGRDVAKNLKLLLDSEGIAPPYILVGHSIGGLYSLSYAHLYPEDVLGVVLVDSRMPDFTDQCLARGGGSCRVPAIAKLLMPEHQTAEIDGMPETQSLTRNPKEFGNLPISMLVASNPPALAGSEFQQVWEDVAQEFADGLANSRLLLVEDTSHYIHQRHPGLIVREIQRVLHGN